MFTGKAGLVGLTISMRVRIERTVGELVSRREGGVERVPGEKDKMELTNDDGIY
jgi:hypothetical protein